MYTPHNDTTNQQKQYTKVTASEINAATGKKIRIGYIKKYGSAIDPGISREVDEIIQRLKSQNKLEIVEIYPVHDDPEPLMAQRWRDLLQMQYQVLSEDKKQTIDAVMVDSYALDYEADQKQLDLYTTCYKIVKKVLQNPFTKDQAAKKLTEIRNIGSSHFKTNGVDLLISPTLGCFAWDALKESPHHDDPQHTEYSWNYCFRANMCGQPAMSIPCGLVSHPTTSSEVPLAIHLVGEQDKDDLVLQTALLIETMIPTVYYPAVPNIMDPFF